LINYFNLLLNSPKASAFFLRQEAFLLFNIDILLT
jgi:hypothetical protein